MRRVKSFLIFHSRNTFALLADCKVWDDGFIKGLRSWTSTFGLQAIAILPSISIGEPRVAAFLREFDSREEASRLSYSFLLLFFQ